MPEGYKTPKGPSIIKLIQNELDDAYAEMMVTGTEYQKGECSGLARALARAYNPYNPNVRAQKLAAKERYDNAQV